MRCCNGALNAYCIWPGVCACTLALQAVHATPYGNCVVVQMYGWVKPQLTCSVNKYCI